MRFRIRSWVVLLLCLPCLACESMGGASAGYGSKEGWVEFSIDVADATNTVVEAETPSELADFQGWVFDVAAWNKLGGNAGMADFSRKLKEAPEGQRQGLVNELVQRCDELNCGRFKSPRTKLLLPLTPLGLVVRHGQKVEWKSFNAFTLPDPRRIELAL